MRGLPCSVSAKPGQVFSPCTFWTLFFGSCFRCAPFCTDDACHVYVWVISNAGLRSLNRSRGGRILIFPGFSMDFWEKFLRVRLSRSCAGTTYYIPVRKWILRQSPLLQGLRAMLISIFIVLALFTIFYLFQLNLILMKGFRDVFLFSPIGIPALVFLINLGVSAVLYRPFCRFAGPYAVLMSIAAWKSMYRMKKTPKCTGCGKCDEICPTSETLANHKGNECYLCGRCSDVCPVGVGIRYQRRNQE